MFSTDISRFILETHILDSAFLLRKVTVDCYVPALMPANATLPLLLVNDGQDLRTMNYHEIVENVFAAGAVPPIFTVAMHCSTDRKNEYGTAKLLDYKGRGAKSALYTKFVMEELLPYIRQQYQQFQFSEKAFAGFSLGGLTAMDIALNHPSEFTKVGVFSGSFWWRDKDQDDEDFDEEKHRIMQRQVRESKYYPWMKFFFEVGTKDEIADRNNNGIIDSIDDTLAVIESLKKLGYTEGEQIFYLELAEGRHDVPTWAMAFPYFLRWCWG